MKNYTAEKMVAKFNALAARPMAKMQDYSTLTYQEKIQTLQDLGGKIEDGKTYKVTASLGESDCKNRAEFLDKVAKIGGFSAALKLNNDNGKKYDYTTEKTGARMGLKEKIAVLESEIKPTAGKIEVPILGGENFRAMCDYIRGLSAEDYAKIVWSDKVAE